MRMRFHGTMALIVIAVWLTPTLLGLGDQAIADPAGPSLLTNRSLVTAADRIVSPPRTEREDAPDRSSLTAPVYLPFDLKLSYSADTVVHPNASDSCDINLAGGMCAYHGDLHSHTSYSDGEGTPAEAYAMGRANGLDFFAITDHAFMLDDDEWNDLLTKAYTSTVNNEFVGIAGYEWTSYIGHMDVFNTKSIIKVTDPEYDTLDELYAWLSDPRQINAVAQLNHPYRPVDAFNYLELDPLADLHISMVELQDGQSLREDKYQETLLAGWHVGPTANSDTHRANWGAHSQRTGIVAPSLTYFDLINALRARRTFASRDKNLVLVMRANDYWMGSVVPAAPLQFDIFVYDPDPDDIITTLEFFENGNLIKSTAVDSNSFRWRFSLVPPMKPGTWWYVKAKQNRDDAAYTSPIWVHQPKPYDILIRDNMWDLGAVPSNAPSWQSPDVWVRNQADGQIWHQDPMTGQTNYVYARIQNIGLNPLSDATAYFYWSPPSLALAWPRDWNPINLAPLHIPELAPGQTVIISVPWDVTPGVPEHAGLLVSLVSAQDPIRYQGNAKWDNNIAQKNVHIVDMTSDPTPPGELFKDDLIFQLANPYSDGKTADIHVTSGDFPAQGHLILQLESDLFDLWMASDMGGTVSGAIVDPISKTIDITIPVNAVVYGLPLEIGEISTATLELGAPAAATYAVHISERIGAEEVGGNLFTTATSEKPRKIELQASANSVVISRTVELTSVVVGDGFIPVADGTQVQFNTTLGSVGANVTQTSNGVAATTFTANSLPGTAIIQSSVSDAVTATTAVEIHRTCWVRLNDEPTDYWTVQAAVEASSDPSDVVKVAGHCTVVNTHGGPGQVVSLDKTITVRGGYTTTNWTTPSPIINPTTLDAEGRGRAIYVSGNSSPTIEGLHITGGDAAGLGGGPSGIDAGGGIYVISATPTIKGNWIFGNGADIGGGMYLAASDATLINNMVTDNQAADEGDGLYIEGSSARLWHTTIARNGLAATSMANSAPSVDAAVASSGTGVFVTNQGPDFSTVILTNTILVSQGVGLNVTTGNTTQLEATLWGTATWANSIDWMGDGIISTGNLNIREDPAFSCPGRSHACTTNPEMQDYHIGQNSAARDAGLDAGISEDTDGDPRIDSLPDLGADEFLIRLTVAKYADPDRVPAGEKLTYTIRVTNTGDADLHAVVTDTLPAHIVPGGQAGGTVIVPQGTVSWTPTITNPWGTWIQTVAVTVEAEYIGPLTNVVAVMSDEGAQGIYTTTSSAFIQHHVYLPISMRDFPAPFCAPQLATRVLTGRQSYEIALDTAGRRAFVAHADGVAVINTENFSVIAPLQAPTATHGIAYDPDHNRIWVTRKEVNQVIVLDGATYDTLATLPTGAGPHSIAYNPSNNRVYVTNYNGWSVSVYNAETLVRDRVLTDFAEPAHLAVNPRTNKIYVANHSPGNHVTVINGATHSTHHIPTALIDAYGIAVDPTRNLIYVTAISQARFSVIDGATETELGYVDVRRSNGKKAPLRVVAVNPDMGSKGHLWLVTSSEDGGRDQLLLIPNGWPTLGRPIPLALPSYPLEGIAVQPDRDRIWVTSVESGLVSVVQDGEPVCPSAFAVQGEGPEAYRIQVVTNP